MEKLNVKKFEKFELENAGSIWGGTDCKKYCQQVDYTEPNCTPDDTCWVCDDPVIVSR
jgi:hypothetical protein